LATAVSVNGTGNPEIDGLLGGVRWSGTITYSFPDSPSDYSVNYYGNGEPTKAGFAMVPVAIQQAVTYAFALIASYTNATIQFAGTNGADIAIAQSPAASPTAYAYYPANVPAGGDVWFGTAYDYSQARLGNYYFVSALHELGHALGLKHSQELAGVSNVAVPTAHDNSEYTVMSYRSYAGAPLTGYTSEAYGYAQTYMANDILALQTLYGANFTTRSENTVYSWSSTTGQQFVNGVAQLAPGNGTGGSSNRIFETVWDGNGIDTYDFSNYTTALRVNLNPGASSTTSATQIANLGNGHYASGNIYNAYLFNGDVRSYIDNAIGGSGNDSITGNAIANNLNGGGGNDTLTGGGGNDTIVGGTGTDVVVFTGNRANYLISYAAGTQTFTVTDQRGGSPDGVDTVTGVENFQFADGIFASTALTTQNHAPVMTVSSANVAATAGQTFSASSLFAATDADGDTLSYYLYDGNSAANSGHWVVNGTVVSQQYYYLAPAQLAQTSFVAGAAGVSDDLAVVAYDGQVYSNNSTFTYFNVAVAAPINRAPVMTVSSANMTATAGQTFSASSLFAATDADGDTLSYYLYDGNSAANSGHWVVNGSVVSQQYYYLAPAQLAQTSFVAGAAGVSDDLAVVAYDGKAYSNNSTFTYFNVAVAAPTNHAPAMTVSSANVTAAAGQTLSASSLFAATDADGDTLSYYLYDGNSAANSGHWVVNGTVVSQQYYYLAPAELAQTSFVAGAAGVSDNLAVVAYDGQVYSNNSNFTYFNVVAAPNHAPVLTVPSANVTATAGQTLSASSLFAATDADGDTLSYYLYDGNSAADSGHWVVNGSVVSQQYYYLAPAQLAQTSFVVGAKGVSDDLAAVAYDGQVYSGNSTFTHFYVGAALNTAPVMTVSSTNVAATPGQTFSASSLFAATDADGDTLSYYLYDGNLAANSGHWVVNGSVVSQQYYYLAPAQLAQTSFVAGDSGVSDNLAVVAYDGQAYSNNSNFTYFNVAAAPNHAPVLTVPSANVAATAGQTFSMASLFTATDADGDALRYFFHDAGIAADSGHFVVNGTAVQNGTDFSLTAAQLAQTVFVAGATGTSDQVYVQLFDGRDISSLGVFNFNVAPVAGSAQSGADFVTPDAAVDPLALFGLHANEHFFF
jgi:Ca2+-binding RTX toxin-like protein